MSKPGHGRYGCAQDIPPSLMIPLICSPPSRPPLPANNNFVITIIQGSSMFEVNGYSIGFFFSLNSRSASTGGVLTSCRLDVLAAHQPGLGRSRLNSQASSVTTPSGPLVFISIIFVERMMQPNVRWLIQQDKCAGFGAPSFCLVLSWPPMRTRAARIPLPNGHPKRHRCSDGSDVGPVLLALRLSDLMSAQGLANRPSQGLKQC